MSEKFFIDVHGCQMNVYDSRRIVDTLTEAGFTKTSNSSDADILIVYTCNIREKAAQKVFSRIRALKTSKTKVVAIGGCVPQAEKKNILKNKDINIAFGPQVYHKLTRYILEVLSGQTEKILDIEFEQEKKFGHLVRRKEVSHSEFVTIQEGCDNFCTYCVVPYTRGREYSRPVIDIINETKELLQNGAKEIILIGQNVNSFASEAPYINIGQPKAVWRIERLIQEIAELDGLKRLRYTTSHPKDFTNELMEVHAKIPVLVPFTHIPAQSGSDRILKMMNRGHTAKEYLNKLANFRSICPRIQFSSDFIVGFPSETNSDFEDTLKLTEEVKYTISYSFKYSPRKNTPAAAMEGQIPDDVKNERLQILQAVLMKAQLEFNKSLIGQKYEVLFDKIGKYDKQYVGKNVYSQSVIVESDSNMIGTFGDVIVERVGQNSVFGKLL
ncbi:MAG: tRNA (N6-isopentenyl adenosine(37)-C2)-methylthiotransferase MiaB [Holosporales bacterium]|jgi:tRNA-2-methylthio-N6-dimethylallyladenosine synthase|nr:tRNA (N6-isopentenyl adenosine(37)-C2)-methylthiotransferase MiaB [Holosporales bacterium]